MQPSNDQELPENFRVTSSTLQAILNYLARQPYAEVAELVGLIQQSEPILVKQNTPRLRSTSSARRKPRRP